MLERLENQTEAASRFLVTDGAYVQRWYGKLSVPASGFMGERLNAGMCPFLIDHDRTKLGGLVGSYEIEGDNLIFVVPMSKRSTSSEAANVWPDIDNGVRPGVSPGVDMFKVSILSEPDAPELEVEATKWDADELSSVTIPANAGARRLEYQERMSTAVWEQLETALAKTHDIDPSELLIKDDRRFSDSDRVLLEIQLGKDYYSAKLERDALARETLEKSEGVPESLEAQTDGQEDTTDMTTQHTALEDLLELGAKYNEEALAFQYHKEGKSKDDLFQAIVAKRDVARAEEVAAAKLAATSPPTPADAPTATGSQTAEDRYNITALGIQHEATDLAKEAVEAGKTEVEFREKLASIVINERRVTMTSKEQREYTQPFSFDHLAMWMLNKGDKDRMAKARFEVNTCEDFMAQVEMQTPSTAERATVAIPDAVVERMRVRPRPANRQDGYNGSEQLALTVASSAAAIATSVDYARSQMALYDRIPLLQYCDLMPGQVGDAKIPIWTAGPTVENPAEGALPAESTPTMVAHDIKPIAFATMVNINAIADLQTGRWLTDGVRMHMVPFLDEKILNFLLTDTTDGIMSITDIETVPTAAADWAKVVDMEVAIDENKAMDFGGRAYVMSVDMWGKFKTIDKSTGAGRYVLDLQPWGFNPGTMMINGYPALRTTLLPEKTVVFTDWWGNMKVPEWSGYEFSLDIITNALKPRITMYKFVHPKALTGRGSTVAKFTAS